VAQIGPKKVPQSARLSAGGGCNRYLGNAQIEVMLNSKVLPLHAFSAQRVGFFNIGSGRVLEKIPGSGSGSGRVGVLKNKIRYFRVSFLLSGNSGYSGYFRVIPGIPGNSQIICSPKYRVIPETTGNTRNFGYYPKFRVIPDISGYPLPDDFQN